MAVSPWSVAVVAIWMCHTPGTSMPYYYVRGRTTTATLRRNACRDLSCACVGEPGTTRALG
eukprot:4168545-Alexandrium_andersonii.AAC.1